MDVEAAQADVNEVEQTDESETATSTKLVELQLALVGFGERWEHVTLDEADADRLIGQGFAIEIQDEEETSAALDQENSEPEIDTTPVSPPTPASKSAVKSSAQMGSEGTTVATGGVISPDKGTGGVTV